MESREEIKNSIAWINVRAPLTDLQKQYIGFILNQQNKTLTDEIAELKDYRKWFFEEQERADKLRMKNLQLQSRIDELQKVNEWISVELAPKDGTYILGYNDDSDLIKIVYWNSSMGNGCWNGDRHIEKISHWMPLPNNPKTN